MLRDKIKKNKKPRNRSAFGAFLACLTRFERAAFRVGGDLTNCLKGRLSGAFAILGAFFHHLRLFHMYRIQFKTYIPHTGVW